MTDLLTLPPGYSWGGPVGDYHRVMRDGQCVTAIGGLPLKVAANPASMQAELIRAIFKGEMHMARAGK